MTFAFLYINIYHDYWNTEESQYTLIRFENKDKESKCQDSDSYMITLPLCQMRGLEVKFFNVLQGPYCHFDNDIHLSTHSKNTQVSTLFQCVLPSRDTAIKRTGMFMRYASSV